MDRVVGISDRANAAFHTLAVASRRGGSLTAKEAAGRLGLSPSYLTKILRTLSVQGILVSTRGVGGGFSLAREPESISLMDVLVALDGPLPVRSCLFEKAVCDTGTCLFKVLCRDFEARLRQALEHSTIADLAASFSGAAANGAVADGDDAT